MNDFHMEYISAINTIFERLFAAAYRQSNPRNRARLLPYVSGIHRRWFYSALIRDTLLTPANLFESINRAHGKSPSITPSVRSRSESRFNGIAVSLYDYTTAAHPVVTDLTQFIRLCDTNIELDENDDMFPHQALTMTAQLSQFDPHYVSYLMNIAITMGLVVKLPSIYANHAQIARDAEERLTIPSETLFDEIVEATIAMSANNLTGFIMLPEPLFDETFIRSLLTQPMDTDEIFHLVYATLGMSLEELIQHSDNEWSDRLSETFLSGTYIMGILLDKYFFTPFGHYLKLIRPTYALPFKFDMEVRDFTETRFDEDDLTTLFFSPCSRYFFTDLGLSYFGITPTPHNYLDVQDRMPFSMLRELLFSRNSPMYAAQAGNTTPTADATQAGSTTLTADATHIPDAMYAINAKDETEANDARQHPAVPPIGLTYAMKIRSETEPTQWLNLLVPSEMTLQRLYTEVSLHFRLINNGEYSFFHDSTENPFAEYTSLKKSGRTARKTKADHAKKTVDTTLDSLDFKHKRHMVLAAYNQFDHLPQTATAKFTLEVFDTKPLDSNRIYPVITRISKSLKAFQETFD